MIALSSLSSSSSSSLTSLVVVEDESPEASKSVESRKTDMKQITDIGLPRSFAAEKLYLELELAWARA